MGADHQRNPYRRNHRTRVPGWMPDRSLRRHASYREKGKSQPMDLAPFSLYEGRPRIDDVGYLARPNRPARCLCRQISYGRLPAPSLRSCEMHVQMRLRPYSQEIRRPLSARCPLPPGARALAQCERADNTRSGSSPLHSRTAVAACAVLVRPPSLRQQGKRLFRPSCAPTPELSTRPYLRASEEEQSQ
jgi:hypothetical protein